VLLAAEAQLTNSNLSFGQGFRGYAHYFGAAYADYLIGDYMTEAVFPTIPHQDARHLRRGAGGGWSRPGYAVGQIFRTRNDSGRGRFNFPEIAGNSTSVRSASIWRRTSSGSSGQISNGSFHADTN
jgi:hypothetical protein